MEVSKVFPECCKEVSRKSVMEMSEMFQKSSEVFKVLWVLQGNCKGVTRVCHGDSRKF